MERSQIIDCTVVVLAYNLEGYILDCLRSIEEQETQFGIRVLVHDDCSSDDTYNLIHQFARESKYQYEVIKPHSNRYQFGMTFFYELLRKCQTKYVAILDGDDMWTDKNKLQLQISQLEENPDIAISTHTFSIVNEDMTQTVGIWPNPEFRNPLSSFSQLAEENFIGALTVVFRRDCLPTEIQGYERLGTGDYGLWGLIVGNRQIGFLDRNMANYRQHSSQVYANRSDSRKKQAVLETKLFVANHSSGEVRSTWIDAMCKDILGEERLRNFELNNANEFLKIELRRCEVELDMKVSELDTSIAAHEKAVQTFLNSYSWRATKSFRKACDLMKKFSRRFVN